ncbi:MAG: GtrA family protein [Actinomycetota bacterium]
MAADIQAPGMTAPSSRMGRFLGFALVGASGLVVNEVALWVLTSKVNLYYLFAAVLATELSTVWNFALVERFVFDGGQEGRWGRLGWFALMNNLWLLVRTPFLYLLTDGAGLQPLISNAIVLGAMTLVRFGIADTFIWADRTDLRGASAMRSGKRIWNYDIHGIIGITSESKLPELIRFQVPALLGPADIEVVVSNQGFGGLRRNVAVIEDASSISYIEQLGRHGFAAKINVDTLGHIQVSKLLRRSPHVAYTNVVEPVVRWVMVRKGYILAHAACLQIDGHGVLITARTDTGKTTTCLKSIKEQGTGFVSDDMVIIDRDGNALSYPKPLTISSHTLNAVKGAPMPRRTRAWLQVQGRLHSKFGRSVGMAFGNINLPVASMSAIVQMIIPPPKFQVDRLIPEAEMVSSLTLDRLVVIERGDAVLQELDAEAAFEILSDNTEDAYGFPPYPRISHALSNGEMPREKEIRRLLVGRLEAVLLRTPDRAWFEMLPRLAEGIGVKPGTELVNVSNEDDLVLDLTGNGASDDRVSAKVIAMAMERSGDPVASRFEKLSPAEAEEVERALSAALALLQKVSDILDGQNENDEPAVSGLVASVRSLRDARMPLGER